MLAIVLGNNGCNSCQIDELSRFSKLEEQVPGLGPVVAIYTNQSSMGPEEDLMAALTLRKVSAAQSVDFYYSSDPNLANLLSSITPPVLLVVDQERIVSSHVPIAGDPEFSEQYLDKLYGIVSNGLGRPDFSEARSGGSRVAEWTAVSADSDTLLSSAWKSEIVIVHHWATWCGPCLGELGEIDSFWRAHRDIEGLRLLTLASDGARNGQSFLFSNGFDLPVWQQEGEFPSEMSSPAIPTTLVLDHEQRVVFRHVGALDWNSELFDGFIGGLIERRTALGPS